jgi:prepilin-type processing-associated H-X9-DG protein
MASSLRTEQQCSQLSRKDDPSSTSVTYWLWRFDKPETPVPTDDFWNKTVSQCVSDLQTITDNPTIIHPNGPADVELAVDPYFPSTITSLPANLRGQAVHSKGRNTLYLDTHATYVRDARLK